MSATDEPEHRDADHSGLPPTMGDRPFTGGFSSGELDDAMELAAPDTEPSPLPQPLPTITQARESDVSLELTTAPPDATPRRRRIRWPLILFITTCLSTFWVGANHWLPFQTEVSVRQLLVAHWADGLIYMACVLAILLTHEMGHFLATVRYHIPASYPFFIPFPISPIGTMGAVIGMDGLRANRKEMFDIGLAGPIAGLLVAVPIMWIGIAKLDLTQMAYGPYGVDSPLIVRLALHYIQPPGYAPDKVIWFSQLNPYFMAGWVGFLITGLNMLPVSQLDGGHLIYTLFGKRAHWIARGFVLFAIGYVIVTHQWNWIVMIGLVLLIGPDHPPTRNDNMPLGRVRTVVGCLCVLIPLFCFAPNLFIFR